MAWERLLLIGMAGSIGAIARYTLSRFVSAYTGDSFPWGTLTVNVLGCLMFGLIWGLGENKEWLGERTRILLLIGFLGAFTTFSSFANETIILIRDHRLWWAGFNVVAQNMLGISAVMLGIGLSRAI